MGESCCATCEQFAGKEAEPIERKPIEGPPARFKIRVREGNGEPFEYVPTKSIVMIGRTQGNDISLPKGNVSRRASAIIFKDGGVYAQDLNSSCGTYVDGRKITGTTKLGEHAKVYIGDFVLEVVDA